MSLSAALTCMHCRHCKEDMLENKFCLHLTRHVFEKDNAFFLKHVAMYEKGIDKERADPFLEERIVLSTKSGVLFKFKFRRERQRLKYKFPEYFATENFTFQNCLSFRNTFRSRRISTIKIWKKNWNRPFPATTCTPRCDLTETRCIP